MSDTRIVRNSAKCLRCGVEIESTHVHDFVSCACGAIFVDGGHEYLRRGGEPGDMQDTSIIVKDLARHGPREEVTLSGGQVLHSVHPAGTCAGDHCAIHNLSDHHMRDWPQWWIEGQMLRSCEHGRYHPDPDSLSVDQSHGCCDAQCCVGITSDTPREAA